MLTLILAALIGLIAGLTAFGLAAAAFAGATLPMALAVLTAGAVTVAIVAKLRPAGAAI